MEIIRLRILFSLFLLGIATICDLKTGKIKNWLTLPILFGALVYAIVTKKPDLWTLFIALTCWFIAGCVGLSGWGDVKCCMALTVINSWQVALNAYLLAQILMVIKYLLLSPKKASKEIYKNANDIIHNNVVIDTTKPKHIFAPYLLGGYLIHILISIIMNGGL